MKLLYIVSGVASVITMLYFLTVMWRVYIKAGVPGVFSIIPIVNLWQYFSIAKMPGWLSIIPIVNIVLYPVVNWKICKAYNLGLFLRILSLIVPVVPLSCIAFNVLVEYDF